MNKLLPFFLLLGIALTGCFDGDDSPTKVKNVDSVVLTQKDNIRVENTQESLNDLISNLVTNHIIG